MFFDAKKNDERYQQLLIRVAKKQRELLLLHFDWNERQIRNIEQNAKKRWKRTAADTPYDHCLAELESIKTEIKQYREQRGYRSGVFWWNIPWKQVESYLIYDLTMEEEHEGWRFKKKMDTIGEDGTFLLYMMEEGHYSDFSGTSSHSFHVESQYTSEERKDMLHKYNRDLTISAYIDLSYDAESPVHSVLSGADYATKADYYLSNEYLATRMFLSESYHKSLYTEVETYVVEAYSNSLHYTCFFNIADYHIQRDGRLDHVKVNNFKIIKSRGNVPNGIEQKYAQRDAAVVCAAFLADEKDVCVVPLALFGKNIEDGAKSYEEAMRQAEIYTCLANKIQP